MPEKKVLFGNRSAGEWFVSFPTFLILLTVTFLGNGEYIHSQLLKLGELHWDQYFVLRGEIQSPACNKDPDIDAEVKRLVAEAEAEAADPLGGFSEPLNVGAMRESVLKTRELCRERWTAAKANRERVTPEVRAFRAVETRLGDVVTFLGQYKQLMLCCLFIICAATTTLNRHHIGLRPPTTIIDHYVSTALQLVAHLMLLLSEVSYRNAEAKSIAEGIQVQFFYLHTFWIAGFSLLALISVWQLIKPPKDLAAGGNLGQAFLSIPLYTLMAVSAPVQFWVIPAIEKLTDGAVGAQPYYQSIGIYLSQLMEMSGMFLSLSLCIWIGMLLKQTRVTALVFDVLRPWKMPPELLCFVVLLIAAWPTAYTGASGIFILAASSLIYEELIRAGARKNLALASSAMSGSMGVVLAPCLLVVIIAALDGGVTTGEMYHYGFFIYLLTAGLFFIVSQLARREPACPTPIKEALPQSLRNFTPLLPYALIAAFILVIYSYLLDLSLNEFSAPYILMVVLFWMVVFDNIARAPASTAALLSGRRSATEIAFREATNETSRQIGALLMLIALSVYVAGAIDHSYVMGLFSHVTSIWSTMTILVAVMIFLGMIMDPYGAVMLVNATVAKVAFEAGIHPLHFWMLALMSFELGYLTPPVALNHLLTRNVVGEKAMAMAAADAENEPSFWYRHERYLLPATVMGIGLMIVAYVPLAWQEFRWSEQFPPWVNGLFTYIKK